MGGTGGFKPPLEGEGFFLGLEIARWPSDPTDPTDLADPSDPTDLTVPRTVRADRPSKPTRSDVLELICLHLD